MFVCFRANLFTILLGSNSLSSSDSNRLTVASSSYVIHPKYNSITLENNIALIHLRSSVQYTGKKYKTNLLKKKVFC